MPEYRELKNRTRFSSTLDNEIYKRLKKHQDNSYIPLSKVFDIAITMYLDSVGSENNNNLS